MFVASFTWANHSDRTYPQKSPVICSTFKGSHEFHCGLNIYFRGHGEAFLKKVEEHNSEAQSIDGKGILWHVDRLYPSKYPNLCYIQDHSGMFDLNITIM